MSFKRKINEFRRSIMRSLTGGIGKGALDENIKLDSSFQLNRVLISRPNQRLGNTLLITPLVQEIVRANPNVKIDLFVKGKVAPFVFETYPQIDQIIELPKKPFKDLIGYIKVWFKLRDHKYDLVINVIAESASGRISTTLAKSKYKIFGIEFFTGENSSEQIHYAKTSVYQFREFLKRVTGKTKFEEYPSLNLQLSAKELESGQKLLDEVTKNPAKKTLAFFTYATGAKCYTADWWDRFYAEFYPKYSEEYNLIEILPVEDISMLNRKLPTFYSKDVREIAAIMNLCEIVIAADSGMMHLSCAAPTSTIGLFMSESFLPKYQPYGKENASVLIQNEDSPEKVLEKMQQLLK